MGYMNINRERFGLLRTVIFLVAVIVLMCMGFACAESVDVTETVRLAYGRSLELAADVPAEAAVWSSDQPEVISVDENGVLTANSFGAANVTCSVGGECVLSVRVVVAVPEEEFYVKEWEPGVIGEEDEPEISAASLNPVTAADEGTIGAAAAMTAREKVEQLAKECYASGATGEYEIALWMHDWLIYNANYDYNYKEYGPEGVLLRGTGVCQSYALAYELMLDRMGIENQVLISRDMNHAWNLVKIEGDWYHVDCTWDDPGTGGIENHNYFCLNDRLMGRDHIWVTSDYPACTSTACYYPVRNGENCAETEAAAEKMLIELVEERTEKFEIYYIGNESGFSMWNYVKAWVPKNAKKYSVSGFNMSGSSMRVTVTMRYSTSGAKQGVHLKPPVKAPDFALNGLDGCYKLSNYSQNGLVLVFGEADCANTLNLLENLAGKTDALADKGVEVLASISGAASPEDLIGMMETCPGLNYVCWQDSLMENCLKAAGYKSATVSYPAIIVISSAGKITYYSTGYVSNKKEVADEAYAVGTGKALPEPEENEYSQDIVGAGNIIGFTGAAAEQLQALVAESNLLLYVMDNTLNNDIRNMMAEYERNTDLYNSLNIRMAVSLSNGTDASETYSGVENIPHDGNLFWRLMYAAGFKAGRSESTRSCFLIDSNGNIVDCVSGYGDAPDLQEAAVDMAENMQYNFSVPAALSRIDEGAFECSAFGNVDLTGTKISEIGSRAFADCAGLKLVRLPDCVESIAEDAFEGSENVVFFCSEGSPAHAFAEENGILCLTK